MPHIYHSLTPDFVLDALASIGLMGDGRLMALSSYENRVYQVHLESGTADCEVVVAKFYRPGRWSQAQILEEHAFAQELAEAEIPVVAPLNLQGQSLHRHGDFFFSVSPRRGGRAPELDDVETLEWIGRLLARIHSVGARTPFVHRPTLDITQLGYTSRDTLQRLDVIALEAQSAWQQACDRALDLIKQSFTPTHTLRLHGDCHSGNILWTPQQGPHFVDLDDARQGPAIQDLWLLLSGDRAQQTRQLGALLDGYTQYRDFDVHEIGWIEALRTLRLLHYSAWLAQRWDDPIFPLNFPWFGTPAYWQEQVRLLQEQIEAMQAPALLF